ncbi:DUF4304 domain-containing protein [Dyadobacter sp. LHD-138]|uniref:DUF4304 domain-containing protein n=1 Tax=Dyadobacter sp. LHD-138 TaxID=3071413 RepID=UPI0027DEED76|nr:DUF4304 domain-containing protein [Dyadobacter sp. LHD-138]MDQ6482139.1 DUF4304 domain-containing protein [Dyadobacter sp. LHD-138]
MTAKEKQTQFIKNYLKPTLKKSGYMTSGQTWWKDKGDFFNVINLQNFSWNSKDSVDFIFNIGIALKATVKDEQKKKATHYDLTTNVSHTAFIPDWENRNLDNNNNCYSITEITDLTNFILSMQYDFEKHILPGLEEPQNLNDLIKFYEQFPLHGDRLKRAITKNKLLQI